MNSRLNSGMNILAFCKIWKKVIKFINASIWEKLDLSAKKNTVWEKMIKNSGCTGRNYYSFQEKDNKGEPHEVAIKNEEKAEEGEQQEQQEKKEELKTAN